MPSVRDNRRSRVNEIFCRSCINVARLLPLNKILRLESFGKLLLRSFVCTDTFCCCCWFCCCSRSWSSSSWLKDSWSDFDSRNDDWLKMEHVASPLITDGSNAKKIEVFRAYSSNRLAWLEFLIIRSKRKKETQRIGRSIFDFSMEFCHICVHVLLRLMNKRSRFSNVFLKEKRIPSTAYANRRRFITRNSSRIEVKSFSSRDKQIDLEIRAVNFDEKNFTNGKYFGFLVTRTKRCWRNVEIMLLIVICNSRMLMSTGVRRF